MTGDALAGSGFYRTAEVAAMWGVTERTVRQWVRQGRMPVVLTPTGRYRYPAATVDAMLARSQRRRGTR